MINLCTIPEYMDSTIPDLYNTLYILLFGTEHSPFDLDSSFILRLEETSYKFLVYSCVLQSVCKSSYNLKVDKPCTSRIKLQQILKKFFIISSHLF